jgi:hypothetical protein
MSSSTDIAAVYHEFTDALTEVLAENAVGFGAAWPPRKGSRRRQEASRLQRVWISSGGRNGIHKLGNHTKHWPLGLAFTVGEAQRPIGRASVDMSALASTGVQKNPG